MRTRPDPGRHRHLDGLRARDSAATRLAVQADMVEGGAGLLRHLGEPESRATRPGKAP